MDNPQDSFFIRTAKCLWSFLCVRIKKIACKIKDLWWPYTCEITYFWLRCIVSVFKLSNWKNIYKERNPFKEIIKEEDFYKTYELIRKERKYRRGNSNISKSPLKEIAGGAGSNSRYAIIQRIIILSVLLGALLGVLLLNILIIISVKTIDFVNTFLFDINVLTFLKVFFHSPTYMLILIILISLFLFPVFLYQLRNYRLGYLGELAVSQELNVLMYTPKCHVFHSVIIENGDIDHVIVCPKGIFCVETKTRRYYSDNKLYAELQGNEINIKNKYQKILWSDNESVKQVRGNAKGLNTFLKEKTNMNIPFIKCIVVYPFFEINQNNDENNDQKNYFVCNHKGIIPLLRTMPNKLNPDISDKVCEILKEKSSIDITEELLTDFIINR